MTESGAEGTATLNPKLAPLADVNQLKRYSHLLWKLHDKTLYMLKNKRKKSVSFQAVNR